MLGHSIGLIAIAALFGVEAYKVKERLPRLILIALAAFFAVWAALVQQIADAWPVVGTFLASLFSDPSTWFVLAIALFFVLRSLWLPKPSPPQTPITLDQLAAEGVLAEVQRLRERLDGLSGFDPAALDTLRRELDDLSERVERNEGVAGLRVAGLSKKVEEYQATHKAVIDDYQRMLGLEIRLDEAREERSKIWKTFNTVFLAFQALRVMGPIERLRATIIKEGEFLTRRVKNGEPVKGDDWKEWRSHKVTFDSAMKHWLEHARGWHPKVEEWINDVKPDDLTNPRWAGLDDQLEGSQAVITYQTFALKFERWCHFESNVQAVLDIAAFTGAGAAETLATMYEGGPTVEGIREGRNG